MTNEGSVISSSPNRRSFLKTGLAAAGAVTMGTGLLARATRASAQQTGSGGSLTSGDVAILQFLAAGEALEADFYTQYNELGGIRDSEEPKGSGSRFYTEKLKRIDPNIPQYIHDITDDEMSHQNFINAYLVSKGAAAVDMEPYRAAWQGAHEYFSLNLISSRGCPYRCNWCAKPVFGSNYHFRSPQRVAREMLRLKREFGAGHIWFADDIFALSPQWTRRFSEQVENLGAVVPFKMQSRCDLMTRDTVGALRRAGCAEVWMGAESGSQKILDAMDKGTRVEQIYEARENLRRHGIRAGFFLQFGYPGETWNEIEQTIRMVRDTAPDDVGISVSYPLPGTKFYDRVAQELGEKVNWRDSDDLSMMFRGAYSTEFYRELADAVHQEVRGGDPQWERVRELERVSANPTLLWTSC